MCGFDYDDVLVRNHDENLIDILCECETWEEFCAENKYDDIQAAIQYLCEKGFRMGLDLARPGA